MSQPDQPVRLIQKPELAFVPGDLKLVCPQCYFTVIKLEAFPDGTPASSPSSPATGKCKRHGWIRLIAIDPFSEKRVA